MKLTLFQPSDDFFTDRLCRRYGPLVFIAAAILIAGAFASPWAFSCWAPAHFEGSHVRYSEDICWNNGKFTMPFEDYIPKMNDNTIPTFDLRKMRYLPIVLLLQIMVFFIPRVFWKTVNTITGYHTGRIIKGAHDLKEYAPVLNQGTSETQETPMTGVPNAMAGLQTLAARLRTALHAPFPFLGGTCSAFGGYSLVATYLLTKIGYLLTAVVQMAILGRFFSVNFFTLHFAGSLWDNMVSITSETVNNETTLAVQNIFPRYGLCDYSIRQLGNVQRYTIQCTISANPLVQRVVVCLWLWLWITFFLLCLSTLTWVLRLACYFIAPQNYKSKRVAVLIGQPGLSSQLLDDFSRSFLKPDGALILEILEDNVSVVAAAEVVKAAWVQFQQERMRNEGQGPASQGHATQGHVVKYGGQQPASAPSSDAALGGMYPVLSGAAPPAQSGVAAPENLPLIDKTSL